MIRRHHLTTKMQHLFKVMWPFSTSASDPFDWSCTNCPSVLIVSLILTFYLYIIINDKFCFNNFHRSHIYCQVTQASNWHLQNHNRIKIQLKTWLKCSTGCDYSVCDFSLRQVCSYADFQHVFNIFHLSHLLVSFQMLFIFGLSVCHSVQTHQHILGTWFSLMPA